MRHEYYVKDGYSVTYSDKNVCFENTETAEAICIENDGSISINNFDKKTTEFLMAWYRKIYPTVVTFRTWDMLEETV